MERTVRTERIYDGKVVSLRVDTVLLDNGKEAKREVVEHHGAVCIVPMLDDQRVVLVRQHRAAVGEDLLELPAGTLRPGEDPLECANRELIEETNLQAAQMKQLCSFYVAPGYSTERITLYIAIGLSECQGQQDDDENVTVEVCSLSQAVHKIGIGDIQDAKTVAGLLLAKHWQQS